MALHQAPRDYYPMALSVETWKTIYSQNWRPITIENLQVQPGPDHVTCYPPVTRRLPGRPKKKRAQKGDKGLSALNYARRANGEEVPETKQRCSSCKKQGHNARTCIEAHS